MTIFKVKVSHLLVACAVFLTGFANAEIKYPRPGKNDISQFSGNRVLVRGSLLEDVPFSNGGGERLTLLCKLVCEESYSRSGLATGDWRPVEGRLQVIIGQGKTWFSTRRIRSIESTDSKSDYTSTQNAAAVSQACEGAETSNAAQLSAPRFQIGQELTFRGTILSMGSVHRKNSEHLRFLLARKRIFAELRTSSALGKFDSRTCETPREKGVSAEASESFEAFASYWRNALVGFHAAVLGEEDGKLLASMVLGDRAATPSKEIADNFRASGLSHILAASGFNLSVVSSSIYFVVRYAIRKIWLANAVCFTGMFVFVAIAGASPSVMRAFIMCSIMLLSRCLCRNLHMPAALSLTMSLVLFFDPLSAGDVGFQLSYFSTAGMILGATEFTDLLNRTFRRCPEWIRVAFAATLVAQACVLPLQLYYFKQLTPYCLLANVVVAPTVPILTIVGFASSLLFWFESLIPIGHFLSTNIDRLCYFPLELTRSIVAAFASLPGAQLSTGSANILVICLYYVVLLSFPLFHQHRRDKHWAVLIALSFVLLLASIAATG